MACRGASDHRQRTIVRDRDARRERPAGTVRATRAGPAGTDDLVGHARSADAHRFVGANDPGRGWLGCCSTAVMRGGLPAALAACACATGCQYNVTTLVKLHDPHDVAVYARDESYPPIPLLARRGAAEVARVPVTHVQWATVARASTGALTIQSPLHCGVQGDTILGPDGTIRVWRPHDVRPLSGDLDVIEREGADVRIRYTYLSAPGGRPCRSRHPIAELDLTTPLSNVVWLREIDEPSKELRWELPAGLPLAFLGAFAMGWGALASGESRADRTNLIAGGALPLALGVGLVSVGLFHLLAPRRDLELARP
jgi:hypothetical protein